MEISAEIPIKKLYLSSPAFNCAPQIEHYFREYLGIRAALREVYGVEISLLIINDNSTDGTKALLDSLSKKHDFLRVIHNDVNRRNANNIITGYTENLNLAREEFGADAQDRVLIGTSDADGEHNPLLFFRHIDYIVYGVPVKEIRERIEKSLVKDKWMKLLAGVPEDGFVKFDGVVGSIIYPDHSITYQDATFMRFHGMMQSAMFGVPEPFYIQSPGWQLHRYEFLRNAVTNLIPRYRMFFAGRNEGKEFPSWGMHGVVDDCIAMSGGKLWSAFLECYGTPPNRNFDKLEQQNEAATIHARTLNAFRQLVSTGYA